MSLEIYMDLQGTISSYFRIGSGSDEEDILIELNLGLGPRPALKYNYFESAWQYSNDGEIFFNMGSGSGSGEDEDAFHISDFGEIYALTNKATPVDADVLLIENSASSPTAYEKNKLTWANVKVTLKTYFDVLYTPASVVEAQNSGHTLTIADDNGKTFTCDSTTSQTFNLPSVTADDIDAEFTFVKLGVGALVIHAADDDVVEDSGPGLTIYCSDVYIASITLKLVTATQWVIQEGATGNWTTTV
jgi:hypothetical protein